MCFEWIKFDFWLLLTLSIGLQVNVFCLHQFHRHNHNRHNRKWCPSGFGLDIGSSNSSHGLNMCVPCQTGVSYSYNKLDNDQWSSSPIPCLPCSLCGAGLYVAHECIVTADTVCDSCHTYRGPHNTNYLKRCVSDNQENQIRGSSNSSETIEIDSQSFVTVGLQFSWPTILMPLMFGSLMVLLAKICVGLKKTLPRYSKIQTTSTDV